MGIKRNRFLIRQPRIKRDSDTINQQSPEYIEFEAINSPSLLTVPPKIERHSSEPAPSMTPSSPQLLSVPCGPLLVKQHSHPLLPSQSSPTSSASSLAPSFALHRQLSHPTPSSSSMSTSEPLLSTTTCTVSTNTFTHNTPLLQFVSTSSKSDMESVSHLKTTGGHSPSVILLSEPINTSGTSEHVPTIRVRSEELHRSISTPQTTGELILEPRSSHCPVIRPGPALGCNFCWNTIDAHGRILRRKTKYHCPECQTNLCIVPCFQEYHERQSTDNPSSESTPLNSSKNVSSTSLRHYPKTGSI